MWSQEQIEHPLPQQYPYSGVPSLWFIMSEFYFILLQHRAEQNRIAVQSACVRAC